MDTATQPVVEPTARFLWDVERYEEAIVRGVFTTEDPIELIDGELITHMAPQYSTHATAVQLASIASDRVFGDGYYIRQQVPLHLGSRSMPEPDVAVVRGRVRDFARAHPTSAELVVEVADSSLAIDRGRKLRLYAREGILEYWIVNLTEDCVEVCRQPVGENYADVRTYRRGENIATGPGSQPVAVADLLP